MAHTPNVFDRASADWQARMAVVVEMMREMSLQTQPQAMFRAYRARMAKVIPTDTAVSLSRRDLEKPKVRITRYSGWEHDSNPWENKAHLPIIERGVLSDLIYGDEPHVIDDLKLAHDDPAREYFAGIRSLIAIPLYDRGESLNMVILARREKAAFNRDAFPEHVWTSNLFGRATQNLVLSQELKRAYEVVDHEMKVVAEIQRALLPDELPNIPTMDLAASYETSQRAGGDYYDFFELADGKWGILIADVSGHGTPAAVIMAILHSIAHGTGPCMSPSKFMAYLNKRLMNRYTMQSGSFVTAFYAVYDPKKRALMYASAGHNPPRMKRCDDGSMASLDGARGLPLCVVDDETYAETTLQLRSGDQIIFYTDGITEAQNPRGEMFEVERLDETLHACRPGAQALIDAVLASVTQFVEGKPADDDRTVVVAKIT